jgi:hypothetical protein
MVAFPQTKQQINIFGSPRLFDIAKTIPMNSARIAGTSSLNRNRVSEDKDLKLKATFHEN